MKCRAIILRFNNWPVTIDKDDLCCITAGGVIRNHYPASVVFPHTYFYIAIDYIFYSVRFYLLTLGQT